jgi:hypothetical protein
MNLLLPKVAWISILAATLLAALNPTLVEAQNAQVRRVAVHPSSESTQIEIETSRRVMPMTQVLSDPDRLVIDLPDALPAQQLPPMAVNQGEVKSVRVGLLSSNPPMTRVVIDLKSPQDFRLIPSSTSVIVKIGGGTTISPASLSAHLTAPTPAAAARVAETVRAPAPAPKVSETVMAPKLAEPTRPARPSVVVVAPPVEPKPAHPAQAVAVSAPERPLSITKADLARAPRLVPQPIGQVEGVAALRSGGATEIEIQTSQRLSPATQLIAGPDRLVIDFADAVPGPHLRATPVHQGAVKGVRAGLLTAKPPVTRVVLDLISPQDFQLFPSNRSVIVKLADGALKTPAAPVPAPAVQLAAQATPVKRAAAVDPPKKVTILFQDGLLSLTSNRGSLADVLNEIREHIGADINVPAGAEQELVAVSLGPGSPREVLSQLLNGSRYNFIIVGTDADMNKVSRVIISAKSAGDVAAQIQPPPQPEPEPVTEVAPQVRSLAAAPPPVNVPPADDAQPQGDSAPPPPDTAPQPGDPQPAPN